MSSVLIIVTVVGLALGPVLYVEFPREIARWHQAAANESYLDGRLPAAIAEMDRAITWDPQDPDLLLQRAQFHLEAKQWDQGLADCDRARRVAPDSPEVGQLRSQFLQHLGRHREAVAEWKRALQAVGDTSQLERAHVLNGLAYARAVGKVELQEGLTAADEALKLVGDRVAILDPGGYLYFGRGVSAVQRKEKELALASFNEAVRRAEEVYQRNFLRAESLVAVPEEAAEYVNRVRVLRPHLASILQQRAELLESLERSKEAKRDRKRLEELAPSGANAIAPPVGLSTAVQLVELTANVLDTRGFLYFLVDDLPAARRDLERAAAMIQWVQRAYPWRTDAEKHLIVDIRPLLLREQQVKFSNAVIRYHQLLVHEALGKTDAAAEDRQAIEKLGYQPGDELF